MIRSRLEPRLEQRVPAAVDTHEHGTQIADVRADRAQVAPVVGAANHDQRVAIAEVGPQIRNLQLADQQVALVADVGERVLGEVLDRLADPLLLRGLHRGELVQRADLALRDHALRPEHGAAAHDHHVAVAQLLEQRRSHRVHEMHAGPRRGSADPGWDTACWSRGRRSRLP